MSTEAAIASLGSNAALIALPLERAIIKGGIKYDLEKAHLVTQIWHESNFKVRAENLNYNADRLLEIFPKYFKNIGVAAEYAHKPEKIANRVYGNRGKNGPATSGHGYKYRGRGLIQLTFFGNYLEASLAIFGDDRLVHNPDLALLPEVACAIAVWYWTSRKIGPMAMRDDIVDVREAVNGGTNGLDNCKDKLIIVKKAFKLT